MAQQVWKAESDVVDLAMELIGQHHPDLALVSDEIAIIFREKAGKDSGQTHEHAPDEGIKKAIAKAVKKAYESND